MKTVAILFCLAAIAVLANGCVSRTVSRHSEYKGNSPDSNVIEQKTIWIWQEEFRNPKNP